RPIEFVLVDERRPDQAAVVGVAPRVVRTLDRALGVAARFGIAEPRASVAADVVERAELRVLAADDHEALAGDVDGDEIAGLGRLVGPGDVHPLPEEDPL